MPHRCGILDRQVPKIQLTSGGGVGVGVSQVEVLTSVHLGVVGLVVQVFVLGLHQFHIRQHPPLTVSISVVFRTRIASILSLSKKSWLGRKQCRPRPSA